MFFELSKVLSFFFVPSNIMVSLGLAGIALLAIGYVRAGRWLLVASILLITAVGVLPIGNGLALPLEARFPPWDAKHGPPTGIVVVGGGVIKSEISAERDEVTFASAAAIAPMVSLDRCTAALHAAHQIETDCPPTVDKFGRPASTVFCSLSAGSFS